MLLLFSILILFLRWRLFPFNLSDSYAHIAMGNWMIEHKEIPYTLIGNWLGEELNLPWTAHEWLTEVMFSSLLGSSISPITISRIMFFVSMLFLSFSYFYMHDRGRFGFLVMLSVVIGCSAFVVLRPQVMSYIFFVAELVLLKRGVLWPIPIIALVWANMHGGSSNLSYILPAIILAASFWGTENDSISVKSVPARPFFLVLFLSLLTICINPNGITMLSYPYQNMELENMLSYISEWQPFSFTEHSALLVPIITTVTVLYKSKKRIDLADCILLAFLFSAGVRHARLFAYFIFAMPVLLVDYIPKVGCISEFREKRLLNAFLLFLVLQVAFLSNRFPVDERFEDTAAYSALVSANPSRLYNFEVDTNGWIDGVKPSWDFRADALAEDVMPDFIAFTQLNVRPQEIIDKYRFDVLLIRPGTPLGSFIVLNKTGFDVLYRDENYMVVKVLP